LIAVDLVALKAEILNDPAAMGYAALDEAATAARLNAKDIDGALLVATLDIKRALFLRGVWGAVKARALAGNAAALTLADALALAAAFGPTATEALTLGASEAAVAAFGGALSEGVTPGESVAAGMGWGPTLAEAVTLGDAAAAGVAFDAALSDGVTLTDAYEDSGAAGGGASDYVLRERRRGRR
jgi:hypothetical protein